jgi:hypothetical protein
MGLVSGSIELNANFQDVVSSGFVTAQTLLAQLQSPAIVGAKLQYTSGTGALQADGLYYKPIALVAGTPQTLDLTALTGIGGEALTVNRVREFLLFNPDTHDVLASQGASNGWAPLGAAANPQPARANNGLLRISDPNSTGAATGNVVTSTSKTVKLDPGANPITVYLLILTGSVA